MKDLGITILAAGLGKRMNSSLPKVLHPLAGIPLLAHVLRAAESLDPQKIVVVVGRGADEVKRVCGNGKITWVLQERQLGTGDAVRCAQSVWRDFAGDILILSGDVPLISHRSLERLLLQHRKQKATITLVTASVPQPAGYGRILRDEKGALAAVVEEPDANEAEKKIKEVNAGIYAVSSSFLFTALAELTNHNRQKEYYLPDIVRIALGEGKRVETLEVEEPREVFGINTREELAAMEKALQEKINRKWMEAGVTLKDPQTTYIEEGVVIGRDTVVGPGTHLSGRTVIGERCSIDGNAYVTDARLGNEVHIKFSVVLAGCDIKDGVVVGPFAHLRPGTVLERNVAIGTFVEVKESRVGEGTKASHLAYIGDATVGRETNIGAGTITCNYDGFEKHRTLIGDRVQVGSNSELVAPVAVGDDAYIGAGSTITKDVPAGALALSRAEQKHVEGWVERFRAKKGKSQK
ncbi:MAG: bifunctional UDP-N-acetylglucosamine diphosphorylase/glucosamine-1-phosphate N-acetyltransferase GlmU [Candidatus Binatia bacterium]